jgi:hypothetical protein
LLFIVLFRFYLSLFFRHSKSKRNDFENKQ